MRIKVRKEIIKCAKCKKENEFFYLSDFSYGERLVLFDNGHKYAYINLIEDKVYNEFAECVESLLSDNNMLSDETYFLSDLIDRIFYVACDKIDGSTISLCIHKKCDNCDSSDFESEIVKPYSFEWIDIPEVSHNDWLLLSHEQRVECIRKSMIHLF